MTENIVTGKKYRILTDAVNDVWDRISFWTKASDVYFSDNSTLEENKPVNSLKRVTNYTIGMIAYERTAPSWVMLKCTSAGTTAATVPTTYSTITALGTVITDGTAQFTVYDVRPSSTLSDSPYQLPTVNLINNISSELTVNGEKFYFDYQDGKYGYNTSPSRDVDTFSPFRNLSGGIVTAISLPYTATEECIVFIAGTYPGLWNDGFDSRWGRVTIYKNDVAVRSVSESLNTDVGPSEWHAKMGIPLASWCGALQSGDKVSLAYTANGYSGATRTNAWVMKF